MKDKLTPMKFSELPIGASFIWTDSGDKHGGWIVDQIVITKVAVDDDGMGYWTPNYRIVDGKETCYVEAEG